MRASGRCEDFPSGATDFFNDLRTVISSRRRRIEMNPVCCWLYLEILTGVSSHRRFVVVDVGDDDVEVDEGVLREGMLQGCDINDVIDNDPLEAIPRHGDGVDERALRSFLTFPCHGSCKMACLSHTS